jgi:hypothetical protein
MKEDGRDATESEVARDRQGGMAANLPVLATICADCEIDGQNMTHAFDETAQ